MKLWMKITLISLAVTTGILSICLLVLLQVQANALRHADEDSACQALSMYCKNVATAVQADAGQMHPVTLRSVVDYYFTSYAKLLQDDGTFYSLAQDGTYLFNTCPYDPMKVYEPVAILPLDTFGIRGPQSVVRAGTLLVAACSFTVSDNNEYQAYTCVNVASTEKKIQQMRLLSFGLLAAACLCVMTLSAVLIQRALRPVALLTENATRIAAGEYSHRTEFRTADEIGNLSHAFDSMADSIETTIQSLDSQLQQKQLLLSALTHELKTPMTAIIGYSDSLLHMPLNEEQRTTCAQKIHEAGKRTEALAQKMMELISLSQNGAIQMRRFSAEEFMESLKALTPPRVLFTCQTAYLYGDEILLASMVLNLVDNGLKASPDDAPIDVTICENNGISQVIVADKGRGIPKESIEMVTEPFYRVDAARSRKDGGAGLGLALCKSIAARHGGDLTIKSVLGKGTTVVVTLLQFDNNSHTT